MVPYYGDFAEDATVYIPINTFDSNDPATSVTVTNLLNTDVHIHKNGAVAQRNNAAGITMTIDYDSITGNHLLIIDTSDETVAGFWVAGAEYQVRVEGITVDAGTINAWVGAFSIERAGGTIALLKLIQAAVITNAAGVDIAADIIALKAETALIVADTNELQSDDYPTSIAAVKSDTAAILVDTGTTLQAELDAIEAAVITNAAGADIAADIIALKAETVEILTDTAVIGALGAGLTALATQASVDIIDGIVDNILIDTAELGDAVGASLSADIAAVKAETALIVADTNELQTDDYPTSIAAVKSDTAAILTDTAEIGAAGIGLTAIPWNANWDAEVQSECDDAITANTLVLDLPTTAEFNARTIASADYTVVGDTLAAVTTVGTVTGAITDKTGYALSNAGVDAVFDRPSSLTLSFETLLTRCYQILNNAMTVVEATGVVSLKAIGPGAEIALGDLDSIAGTTDRDELTWA